MYKSVLSILLSTALLLSFATLTIADDYLENLTENKQVHGFKTAAVYENGIGKAMGARFVSKDYGYILDVLRIQSVPQAFFWIKTPPTSSKGEPHACEHLLLGKGNRGRHVAALEDMALSSSTAYTAQTRTCYHFNTVAGADAFYNVFETKLQALLHPDFTDEEIRREVCHVGVTEDPETGELSIEEKGTVYTEMVSAFEKPWYYTYGTMDELVYGKSHPLTNISGGHPDVMRTMTPDDMWSFHRATHHLGNMGAVVSIPSEIDLDSFLSQMQSMLARCQKMKENVPNPTIRVQNLPPPKMAEPGKVVVTSYPSRNAEDPGYLSLQYPSTLKLTEQNQFMLDLFLDVFANGQTSNLYNAFINSKTRRIDIGGRGLWGGYSDDLNVAVYFGMSGIKNEAITEPMLREIKDLILDELQLVHDYPDGSQELVAFNERIKSVLVQNRKQRENNLNSPPMFGFRSGPAGRWVGLLMEVESRSGFRKSLVLKNDFEFAEKALTETKNIWRNYIDTWNLLTVPPYIVGAGPNAEMLDKAAQQKEARLAAYVDDYKKQYGTNDMQLAVARYKEAFDTKTAELDALESGDKLPDFVDDPPLTLDEQLQYEQLTLAGDIPLLASTFDNMTSATLSMSMRMDVVPESLLVYLPLLPRLLTDIGVTIGDEVIPFEEMNERLRREILRLSAGYNTGMQRDRIELTITGKGGNLAELKNAIEWMGASLYSPYLSKNNILRIRDIVDQALLSYRNRTKGSEESWVNDPADAYRYQNNPLYLATNSFLTEQNLMQRLKWMLTEPLTSSDAESGNRFLAVLARKGTGLNRAALTDMLTALETEQSSAPSELLAALSQLSTDGHKTIIEILKQFKTILPDIPDANLSGDFVYLCRQTATDLNRQPETVLGAMKHILSLIQKTDNVRLSIVSNEADRNLAMPDIESLLSGLDSESQSVRENYVDDERIVERVRSRHKGIDDPVYAGLIFDGTRNGTLIFTAQNTGEFDTSDSAILKGLAGKLYTGYGPHGLFMKTWAAGLAYSNGYRYYENTGYARYYAERCPDVAETMKFVVGELKNAKHDPGLKDYAVAQIFRSSRAPSSYESRGATMASDITDGFTPDVVRKYRQKILEERDTKGIYDQIHNRMEDAYGSVLIGYGKPLAESQDGIFFLIGPEAQFESLEEYIKQTEGEQPIYRLYPRDYWLVTE